MNKLVPKGLAIVAAWFLYLCIFYFPGCNKPTPRKKTQLSFKKVLT